MTFNCVTFEARSVIFYYYYFHLFFSSQGDSSLDTRSDGSELAKNMSDLLAKVEVVENLTSKVQEELKSERRVRRHLEVFKINLIFTNVYLL